MLRARGSASTGLYNNKSAPFRAVWKMQLLQAESAAPMSNERCVDISHVNLVFGPVGSSHFCSPGSPKGVYALRI